MNQFEKRCEERRKRFEDRIERRQGSGHAWTGIFLLVIGVVALMRSYVPEFPQWIFSWQMLLIAIGMFIGLRHRFHGAAWFILMLVGGTFLVNDYFIEGDIRRHIWPIVLIAIGAFFIFRSRQNYDRHPWSGKKKDMPLDENSAKMNTEPYSVDDFIDATSIFGGTKKNILTKDFKGGDIVNVFGGTELNLTQADIQGTAILELTTIFGGTKLIVPSNWAIKSEAVTIFGGIGDKRKIIPSADSPTKTLVLKGTMIFGGMEIKSY